MKVAFVQFPTFNVVRALDEHLLKSLDDDFSSFEEQERVVAILLALRDLGLIKYLDRGHETWFFLDPRENYGNDVLRIALKKREMLRSVKLSKRIRPAVY